MTYLVVAKVEGRLGSIEGAIMIDARDLAASSVHASIDVSGIDTGIRLRDKHLRSHDFFDVKRFPRVTFTSDGVEAISTDSFRVRGALTIRDVTQPVDLDVTFEDAADGADGQRRARFAASAVLSRRAFGLSGRAPSGPGGLIASDRVDVVLHICAVAG